MGVVSATLRILEFHTTGNISGTVEVRVVKFCVLAALQAMSNVSLRTAGHL